MKKNDLKANIMRLGFSEVKAKLIADNFIALLPCPLKNLLSVVIKWSSDYDVEFTYTTEMGQEPTTLLVPWAVGHIRYVAITHGYPSEKMYKTKEEAEIENIEAERIVKIII